MPVFFSLRGSFITTMSGFLPAAFLARIEALEEEREALERYPPGELAAIIREVGFSCDLCTRCCTRAFNGHVFLFDEEVSAIREIDPDSLEPAPVYELCDQDGTLYTSGYTIRTKGDPDGSCRFLADGRCRIYEGRPSVCRIYPLMLHREPDEDGRIDWRQISGLNTHGSYHNDIPREDAEIMAAEVIRFEERVLAREIAFLGISRQYFSERGLRNVRKQHDDQIRRLRNGETVTVLVYHEGRFEAAVQVVKDWKDKTKERPLGRTRLP